MPTHDLGLLHDLRALRTILEERSVTRAANRVHLSQPAMSRTLQRLRAMFGDELLIRAGNDYELTPRAREVQSELALLVPRLENLVAGHGFDPSTASGMVRIIGTDYTTAALGPRLFPRMLREAPNLEVRIEPRDASSYGDLEGGRADIALTALHPGEPLRWEQLFTDDLVCVVDAANPVGDRYTLDAYIQARHVVVSVVGHDQPVIEAWLQARGHNRHAAVRTTSFASAFDILVGTPLVATLPRRVAERHARDERLRAVEAPEGLEAFSYGMVWHPRLDLDPTHRWLREMIRDSARRPDDTR